MLSGDSPPAPGDTLGNGEQLPGTAAQPHPDSAHDILAADMGQNAGGAKANPTAGEGSLSKLPASVARRLARVEGHLGPPINAATAGGRSSNQTQDDSKRRHDTHAEARGCVVGGSMWNADGTSGQQCSAAEVAARSARQPKLFLSVGHDEYWSGQQRGTYALAVSTSASAILALNRGVIAVYVACVAHVANARENGVHLAFFSGNEM